MLDVSDKIVTRRTATARAVVRVSEESIELIRRKEVPKGDVLEMARAGGIIGAKSASQLMLFCHNIPVEWVDVAVTLEEGAVVVDVTAKTTYKTGCEMEALTGASCAALTVYDMLKPLDGTLEIEGVRLLSKSGGKSDYRDAPHEGFRAAVLVFSDAVSSGRKKKDTAAQAVLAKLREVGVEDVEYVVMGEDADEMARRVEEWCAEGYDLVITLGGTALTSGDVAPEVLRPLLDREVPGIMEAARAYGQDRTPYAMLSRGLAGVRGRTLVLALPGSTRGAEESMNALFPYVLHAYRMLHR